jgi:predicted nucleic acid-binding protein
MYVAGREHPHREPARRFLQRVRDGGVQGCTSTEILQEILYRYCGLRRPDTAAAVYDLFVELCDEVLPVTLSDTDRAREWIAQESKIGVRDAIHAAVMLNNGVTTIASFDEGFDGIRGLKRLTLT